MCDLLSACTTRPVVPRSLHLCGSAGVSGGVYGGPTGSMMVVLSGSMCLLVLYREAYIYEYSRRS